MRESIEETEDGSFWSTIGDLMSALLLIFVLLFVTAMVQLKEEIEKVKQIQANIIQSLESLKSELQNQNIQVNVDQKTGDISILDSILFDANSDQLKPDGTEFLSKFIPAYSQAVFSNPQVESQIVRLIIEGHTSSYGTDSYNMRLSLLRANSVFQYIDNDLESFPFKTKLMTKLASSGRGEIEANQTKDDPQDRKVMFRFQFKTLDTEHLTRQLGMK